MKNKEKILLITLFYFLSVVFISFSSRSQSPQNSQDVILQMYNSDNITDNYAGEFEGLDNYTDNCSFGTAFKVCPHGFTLSSDKTKCYADPDCPTGSGYLGYDSDKKRCEASPSAGACPPGWSYDQSDNVCFIEPTCPINSNSTFEPNFQGGKCVANPITTCKTGAEPKGNLPYSKFCTKRCYDARTDAPNDIKLYSTDGSQNFSFSIRKGFSGWGEIRPYEDGCFVRGQYWKLCVWGNSLVETFVHPVSGKTYTLSAPIQKKYINTFSWSINPNLVALFTRQHGTGKTTFVYKDLVYQPMDQDDPSKPNITFNEQFVPFTGDSYDFIYLEIQPGTLFTTRIPFCS